MRYVIRWEQTTAHSASVEISLADLASWAAAALPLHSLGVGNTTETPAAEQIERSLSKNPHLRDRLLQLYSAAHSAAGVPQQTPRIISVESEL
jgi:hypothetical protein